MMKVREISRWEFGRLLPMRFILDEIIGIETEWFADEGGGLIGTLAQQTDEEWSYAVLKRDKKGEFCLTTLREHILDRSAAHDQLLRTMNSDKGLPLDPFPMTGDMRRLAFSRMA
jgi:hypothetical protein